MDRRTNELLEIQKVDNDTEMVCRLLDFVENISWLEVKDHTLRIIRNWEFKEWETLFVAVVNDCIVGMVTIMKSDYYPLPEIYPWISTLFVTEEYRGQRISGELIDCANKYAKDIGFMRTYIPTEHTGLFEKYGYYYIKDIVNYGNSVDHLYAKDI